MKRNTLNFWINLVSFVVLWFMLITGIIIAEILPPSSGELALSLWGQDRHDIGAIHKYLSYTFIVLMLAHVWLHWTWVCATLRSFFSRRKSPHNRNTIWGIGFLILITALTVGAVIIADNNVNRPKTQNNNRPQAADNEQLSEFPLHIAGSHTLAEAARAANLSVNELKEKLALPENVSPDEKLGRLHREYDFELNDVRQIVESQH